MKNKHVQIAMAFLKLGLTAFGGPASAMGMMRQEFVLKRNWLTEDEFLDFMGISNLIPGPNANELATHIGYKHGGWVGLILAGVCYFIPSTLIVLGLAWIYIHYGALPSFEGLLYGIKPVVIAIILNALMGMLKPRLHIVSGLLVSVFVTGAYLLGIGPFFLLIIGGTSLIFYDFLKNKKRQPPMTGLFIPFAFIFHSQVIKTVQFSLIRLFWVFLKAGALMYGSGYVLLAFIQDDLVRKLGWLTQTQLLDAIAVGQLTPGPLSTTATFVGFITGGLSGALLATFAMFLPGFIFVVITHSYISKLRGSNQGSRFLDGVNFASLGLWAGVSWEIMSSALIDPVTILITIVSFILLSVYHLSASWLILGGGLIGLLSMFLGYG